MMEKKKSLHGFWSCLKTLLVFTCVQAIEHTRLFRKNDVRQTVPSLLRNIHDLQYGSFLPNPKITIIKKKKKSVHLQQNKPNGKDNFFTIFDIWQFQNPSAQSVGTSEHLSGMLLLLQLLLCPCTV